MNTNILSRCLVVLVVCLGGCGTYCSRCGTQGKSNDSEGSLNHSESSALVCQFPAGSESIGNEQPVAAEGKDDREQKELTKGIYLEKEGDVKRIVFDATVCWGADRKGFELFEHLVCKSKEHESILNTTVDAQLLHTGLTAIGAEAGHPSKYKDRKFIAPKGTAIKVTLRYEEKGKEKEIPAQTLIRYVKTKKDLDLDWIFGGSVLVDDVLNEGKKHYLANSGNVICVCSMGDAMMELPIDNAQGADNLFEPVLDRIPPMGTEVKVVLEPILKDKAK